MVSPRRRPTIAARATLLMALLAACDGAADPTAHPLRGEWRGDAAFTPSVAAYRATHAAVTLSVADEGALSGAMRTAEGETAVVVGTLDRDGALHARVDRFGVEGRLHRARRDRATGSGVQSEGAIAVGVISLDLGRP